MEFAQPYALLLAALAIPLAVAIFLPRRRGLAVPSSAGVAKLRPTARVRLARLLPLTRAAGVGLIVVALAGPRIGDANAVVPAEGIDITFSLDISSSMSTSLIRVKQSRIEATKDVIQSFIDGRKDDRIGFVVFARDGLALSPPTLDYRALKEIVKETKPGLITDGTSIGVGLATALNTLRDSTAATRIVILLTDGQHNTPTIPPLDAARLAAALKIKVYTIGVVDDATAKVQNEIDENLMKAIANETGGRYFAADSPQALAAVYDEIGTLETSGVGREHFERFTELAPWFAAPAALLIMLEIVLGATWLRRTAL